MTTIDLLADDSDIDVPISDREEDERKALELAQRIRLLAASDPREAQRLVDELIVRLDRATDGTFREYLDGVPREVAERALAGAADAQVGGSFTGLK
ncbi:hypothetical protein Asp14428_43650 [Actinoplanes sp. NBRC 14428]|nr:hypothetical protein [Pseudosporangium ferrugineum]BCJ52890.1 hypothetical protein Asp14428_43650 [Actinoplanes sp. NBRC 14428]